MAEPRSGARGRTVLIWVGQALILGIVVAFVWRTFGARWDEFRAIDVQLKFRPGWIGASALLVLVTYALLVDAWRRVLRGWGQRLSYPAAFRIWTVSNLGRYVPGKVWSIAGLAVLAERAGVVGWAAAASALVLQVVAIGTGVAVVAATAPGAVSPAWLAVSAAVAVGTIFALASPGTMRALSRLARRSGVVALPWPALVGAGAVTLVSWIAYGLAFWCLARGLLGAAGDGLPLVTAVGIFAGGYIVGLIALFAPGGLGVREAVFLSLLAAPLGASGAVALAAGSRVLLTFTEIGAAAIGILVGHPAKEQRIA